MQIYNIFISHSWTCSSDYEDLLSLLRKDPYFCFKDYSVPEDDPLPIYNRAYYERELENKIENQMKSCSAILILAGVYATYSESIAMEIKVANRLGKPIVAVEKWGSEKSSSLVLKNADRIVGWNSSSIINAIKEVSR